MFVYNKAPGIQLELFQDDLTMLEIPGTLFTLNGDLHCRVRRYHKESNTIDFYVRNGAWNGTLHLTDRKIQCYKDFHSMKSISAIGVNNYS